MRVCYTVELDGRAQDFRTDECIHKVLNLAGVIFDRRVAFIQSLR